MTTKVNFNVAAVLAHSMEQAERMAVRGGLQAENELKDILGGEPARTGRVYQRRSVTHVASAPGEAPAVDTGRLRQSALSHPPVREQLKVSVSTGVATEYALPLELGTERMEPRPHTSRLETETVRRDRILKVGSQAL